MKRVVAAAAVALAAVVAVPAPAGAAPSLPNDPSAHGQIQLCDRNGKPVTSGQVGAKPFVWRAVGSQTAPSPYGGKDAKATLYAFQPRPNTSADKWSGDTLTATSAYTNTAHPMAQATELDFSLADFLAEYPAMQDGLLQLRLAYSATGQGSATSEYATATIQVTGGTWQLAQGTTSLSCTAGSATSSEVTSGIVDTNGRPIGRGVAAAAAASSASAAAAASAGATAAGHAPTATGGAAHPTATSTASPSGSATTAAAGSSGGGTAWWIALPVVAVVVAGAAVWWRRRSA